PTGTGFCVGGMAGAIHRLARAQFELTGDQGELAMGIAPFTQTQIVEEILPAPATQRIGAQLLALLLETAPEVDQRGEVRIGVLPLRVRLIGLLLAISRTLAHVLQIGRASCRERV